jgi:hypothetical protein
MPQDNSSSAQPQRPTEFGKLKPACAQDISWGRPVFRAPELPSPHVAFDPLPFRSGFNGGSPRLA